MRFHSQNLHDRHGSIWTFGRCWWNLTERVVRAEITPDTPIPHPGKGENSWDCGEDAIHSLTCQASTTHDAVGEIVKAVLRSRYRYGGLMWRSATVDVAH